MRIFHNPRCSKSRSTLALIEEAGQDVDVVKYLDTPPSAEELSEVLSLLSMTPRDLMRKHEAPYKDNNLDDNSLSDAELIQCMVDNPILIERPIVISNGKAVIGRPPELVKELF